MAGIEAVSVGQRAHGMRIVSTVALSSGAILPASSVTMPTKALPSVPLAVTNAPTPLCTVSELSAQDAGRRASSGSRQQAQGGRAHRGFEEFSDGGLRGQDDWLHDAAKLVRLDGDGHRDLLVH